MHVDMSFIPDFYVRSSLTNFSWLWPKSDKSISSHSKPDLHPKHLDGPPT